MKKQLEASRSEALLIGQNLPALGGKITGVKKVTENLRQITLEGGKVVNVPATRIKHIVDATLRTKYAQNGFRSAPNASPSQVKQAQQAKNLAAAFQLHAKGKA